METALIQLAVLFLYITSDIYSFTFFKLFIVYLHFWPSNFKTIITENHHKTNHRKPSATCTTLAAELYYHAFLLLIIYYTGPSGSESTQNQNTSLLNNILLIWDYFLHIAFGTSRTPQKIKRNSVQLNRNHRWCATEHMHVLPNSLINLHKVNLLRYTANTKFSLKCGIFQWVCWPI